MVNLTRIYTRTGDDGSTSLGDMSRTTKNDLRLVAYADVDEANCAIAQILERAGGEDALLALDPLSGNDEVLAIVRAGSADCGIDEALVEAAIAATFGG